jgi:hypothetical protein
MHTGLWRHHPAPQHPLPAATLYPGLVQCPQHPVAARRSVVRLWLVLDRCRRLGEGSASGMPADGLGQGGLDRLAKEFPAALTQ